MGSAMGSPKSRTTTAKIEVPATAKIAGTATANIAGTGTDPP